jgi:hypothetical protein
MRRPLSVRSFWILLLLLLPLTAGGATAQEAVPPVTARNAFYVELLGNGLIYSMNYDRLFTDQLSGRVGLMFLGAADDEGGSAAVAATPLMVNYLFGRGNSHFEAGAGLLVISGAVDEVPGEEDEAFSGAIGTGTLGYRYQRPGGGFVFRVGLTPFFSTQAFGPWFGISFGYGF